jgi:hypothetical protein
LTQTVVKRLAIEMLWRTSAQKRSPGVFFTRNGSLFAFSQPQASCVPDSELTLLMLILSSVFREEIKANRRMTDQDAAGLTS